MNSFDALSLMDTEAVHTLLFNQESMQIDAPDMNPALFYSTFDGKKLMKER